MLWLSGPPERRLDLAASYIVDLERKRLAGTHAMVLHFSCSSESKFGKRSLTAVFIHTLLHQIHRFVQFPKEAIGAVFFHAFLDHVLLSQRKLESPSKLPGDRYYTLPELLDADDHAQMDALLSVLQVQQPSELSMIIDRLYMVVPHGDQLLWERFVTELSTFIANLSGSGLKVRVLLTSLPQTGVPAYSLSGIPGRSIEYDKERRGSIAPLSSRIKLMQDL